MKIKCRSTPGVSSLTSLRLLVLRAQASGTELNRRSATSKWPSYKRTTRRRVRVQRNDEPRLWTDLICQVDTRKRVQPDEVMCDCADSSGVMGACGKQAQTRINELSEQNVQTISPYINGGISGSSNVAYRVLNSFSRSLAIAPIGRTRSRNEEGFNKSGGEELV